jgi:hypothetical protein
MPFLNIWKSLVATCSYVQSGPLFNLQSIAAASLCCTCTCIGFAYLDVKARCEYIIAVVALFPSDLLSFLLAICLVLLLVTVVLWAKHGVESNVLEGDNRSVSPRLVVISSQASMFSHA